MTLNLRIVRLVAVGALALVLGTSLAAAQDTLTPDADALFGSATLDDTLPLDPFIVSMVSGGRINATAAAPSCSGYIAATPDYRITLGGNASTLRFLFAAHAQGDTTLVVGSPNGTFSCNDDGFGLDPLVEFVDPAPGVYNIWVGSYSSGAFIPGYLMISRQPGTALGPIQSEILSNVVGAPVVNTQTNTNTPDVVTLDPTAEATFGSVAVAPGFTPAPFTTELLSGGFVNAALLNLGPSCIGYTASAPDFSVDVTAPMAHLDIAFDGDGDTTLVVGLPNGQYVCNDDSDGLDPAVTLTNLGIGQYDIWVGSYAADNMHSGTLTISEPPLSSGTTNPNGMTNVTGTTAIPPTAVPNVGPTATPANSK